MSFNYQQQPKKQQRDESRHMQNQNQSQNKSQSQQYQQHQEHYQGSMHDVDPEMYADEVLEEERPRTDALHSEAKPFDASVEGVIDELQPQTPSLKVAVAGAAVVAAILVVAIGVSSAHRHHEEITHSQSVSMTDTDTASTSLATANPYPVKTIESASKMVPVVTAPIINTQATADNRDTQVKLARIEKLVAQVNANNAQSNAQLTTEVTQLTQQLNTNQAASQQQLGALNAQLNDLSGQVTTFSKSVNSQLAEVVEVSTGKQCLDAKLLPFAVQSIDMINGQAVVSVNYDDQVVPLQSGFSVVGWKLENTDYQKQQFTFINAKGTCVSGMVNNQF